MEDRLERRHVRVAGGNAFGERFRQRPQPGYRDVAAERRRIRIGGYDAVVDGGWQREQLALAKALACCSMQMPPKRCLPSAAAGSGAGRNGPHRLSSHSGKKIWY
ncbi:MAG: hypothetical protein MZV49_01885 [Rhodopseudomonas palustris]|nr:hypothetical protein [Rhodopseudomonas palustris]